MTYQNLWSMADMPDYQVIELANNEELPGWFIEDCDDELESRIPIFNPEYDATGQIITSELMGYTEEDEEIWTTANF